VQITTINENLFSSIHHPLQFTLWLKMSDSDYTVNFQVSVHAFRDKISGFLFGFNLIVLNLSQQLWHFLLSNRKYILKVF